MDRADGHLGNRYPRVRSLAYRIRSEPQHVYDEAAAFEGEIHGFSVKLRGRDATFVPHEHFTDEASARAALEPLLRAWELDAALTMGSGAFALRFISAHVLRQPPIDGVVEATGVASMVFTGMNVSLKLTHHVHPRPPEAFAVDERVQTLAELYLFAKGTPRVLLHTAYSMTTFLEEAFGSFDMVARHLAISRNVFEAVNRLANTRGVGVEARKHDFRVKRSALSEFERAWLLEIMQQVVMRAGAEAAGKPAREPITLETHPLPAPAA